MTSTSESPLLPGAIENYLARRVPVCGPGDRAAAVRAGLRRQAFDTVADVAVVTGGRLVGLIPAERLVAAADDERAQDLMDVDPPVVAPGLDQEKAAWKAVRHGESSLAVVDAHGIFRGLVPPARLMGVLLQEHDEDMTRLAGVTVSPARRASEEALIIRGLSVGVSVRRVLRLEVLTGFGLGLLLGLVTLPVVWAAFGSRDLAVVVAIALFAACAVATVIAMVLPMFMVRLGRDPAYGSGPLATVVQDLLSLLIYFLVATLLLP